MRVVPVIRERVGAPLRRLHLCQCLARLINVVNRAYNLADLLLILVFVLDFVLKVKLKCLVLPGDILDLRLQSCHVALFPVQLLVELLERLLLLLLNLLHLLCDAHLALVKLLVLIFKVSETVFKRVNCVLLAIIDIFAVRNDLFEELGVLVQISQLPLPCIQLITLLPNALLQSLYLLLMLQSRLIECFEPIVLFLAFLLVFEDLLLVGGDVGEDFALALKELLLLIVELLGFRDDVLLLLGETLVNLPLLPLLLKQPNSLQGPLALHYESPYTRQILIANL